MPIGNAIQRGSYVYVYDEHGRQICSIPAGSQNTDGLTGYTQSTVNIRRGFYIYSYDDKGKQVAAIPAR